MNEALDMVLSKEIDGWVFVWTQVVDHDSERENPMKGTQYIDVYRAGSTGAPMSCMATDKTERTGSKPMRLAVLHDLGTMWVEENAADYLEHEVPYRQ